MKLLDELIELASSSLGRKCGESPFGFPIYIDSGNCKRTVSAGEVECYVLTTDKHSVNKQHVRATFYLNNRRISRAKLEAILNA